MALPEPDFHRQDRASLAWRTTKADSELNFGAYSHAELHTWKPHRFLWAYPRSTIDISPHTTPPTNTTPRACFPEGQPQPAVRHMAC